MAFGSGQKVTLASVDGTSLKVLAEISDNRGEVLVLAFSKDGSLVVSGDVSLCSACLCSPLHPIRSLCSLSCRIPQVVAHYLLVPSLSASLSNHCSPHCLPQFSLISHRLPYCLHHCLPPSLVTVYRTVSPLFRLVSLSPSWPQHLIPNIRLHDPFIFSSVFRP